MGSQGRRLNKSQTYPLFTVAGVCKGALQGGPKCVGTLTWTLEFRKALTEQQTQSKASRVVGVELWSQRGRGS